MTTIRTRITALLLCVLLLGGAAPAGLVAFAVEPHEHVFGDWECEDDTYHIGFCQFEGCTETTLEKHEFIEDTDKYIPPTETDEGMRFFRCKQCNELRTEVVDKLPHTEHDYDGIYNYPTCLEDAYWEYTCSICGDTYVQTIPGTATGHDWDGGSVLEEPGCTEPGTRIYQCNHNPLHTYTEAIPATGHSFGPWTQTVAPTATTPGREERVCAYCGDTETREIAPVVPLTLDKTEVSLRANATEKLTPSEKEVVWKSSNERVVKVAKDGTLTAVRRGTAVVTATSADGQKSAECKVSVHYTWWQWIIIIFLLGWIWYLK